MPYKSPEAKKANAAEYRRNNRRRLTEASTRYYYDNQETVKIRVRRYYKANAVYNKKARAEQHRRLKYGLTDKQYKDMLHKQWGLCIICVEPFGPTRIHRASVDHCHTTGKVRGILCHNCNRGLGLFKDNTERLKRAIEYLKGYVT